MDPKDPNAPERAREHPDEAGAYIGRQPERGADTIPGGVRPDDERIAAGQTQATGGDPGASGQAPEGHREGSNGSDDDVRQAGDVP
jgi:hypothetical protein